MSGRFWFYLGALIVAAALGTTYLANTRQLEARIASIDQTALAASEADLKTYLAKQTDGRKLVGLAILYSTARPQLVKPVALRAFELNKDSRDIAVLAAPYSKEAKERIQFLDPLFDETGAASQLGQ